MGGDAAERAVELRERGNDLFARGLRKEAVEAYTEGLTLDPSCHLLLSNRSAAYIQLNMLQEAVDDARECVKLAPDWAKGFTRLAQALYRLGNYDECNEVIDSLEKLDPENRNVKTLREAVKQKRTFLQLSGKWYGKVSDELGGYVQTFDFKSETDMVVSVFGRELGARLKLNANQEPGWLDLLVQQEPGSQPAPEVKHIFKLEGDVLHLCSPYLTPPEVRPIKFEGPAYVQMVRGVPPEDEGVKSEIDRIKKMSLVEQSVEFAEKVTEILPTMKMSAMENMTTESEETNAMVLASVKFQNDYYELMKLYGKDAEEQLQKYLIKVDQCPTAEAKAKVDTLRQAMVNAGMLPDEDQINSNIESLGVDASNIVPKSSLPEVATASSATKATAAPAAVEAKKAESKAPASVPTPSAEVVTPAKEVEAAKVPLALIVGAGAIAVATIAFFAFRKQQK